MWTPQARPRFGLPPLSPPSCASRPVEASLRRCRSHRPWQRLKPKFMRMLPAYYATTRWPSICARIARMICWNWLPSAERPVLASPARLLHASQVSVTEHVVDDGSASWVVRTSSARREVVQYVLVVDPKASSCLACKRPYRARGERARLQLAAGPRVAAACLFAGTECSCGDHPGCAAPHDPAAVLMDAHRSNSAVLCSGGRSRSSGKAARCWRHHPAVVEAVSRCRPTCSA